MASAVRLDDIVAARSIAVVGASQDPGKIGGRPIQFLLRSGFDGGLYPVNGRYTSVQGLPCYPDLDAIPGRVDVVIVSVPAREVLGVIEACGRKGAKAAIVFSSGFGEVGEQGRALEAALAQAARQAGVRVLGPNCQGLVAVHQRMNLSFSSAFVEREEPGEVGLVVESGAVGGMMASLLGERGVGFSHWISSGNEADIDAAECIDFFARDPRTRIVAAYVENMHGERRLAEAVATARAAGKPVVLLRAGRSGQSARAAVSHTGATAAEDRVVAPLLREAGVTEARDIQELLDFVYAFARVRKKVGRRIGIVGNSGGLGVIMSDTCADLGLELPPLSAGTRRDLAAFLPAFGATGNPIDVTAQILGDPTLLGRALDALVQTPEIDAIVVALAMVNRMYPVDAIAGDVIRVARASEKPVMVSWMACAPEGEAALAAAGLPVFTDATRCLTALAALERFARDSR